MQTDDATENKETFRQITDANFLQTWWSSLNSFRLQFHAKFII